MNDFLSGSATRLLLLGSRTRLSSEQQVLFRTLARDVRDWDLLSSTAARKFSLPILYQNLISCDPEAAVRDDFRELRNSSMNSIARTLRNHAAFSWFHTNCVAPVAATHAYFKGPALAASFYATPLLRHFRDIDLLVGPSHVLAYAKSAVEAGCRPWDPSERKVLDLSSSDLSDYCHYSDTVSLVTPHGILVELHQKLDPGLDLFDTDRLLEDAKPVSISGQRILTLEDESHFVFICYHNTAHLWSKLSWISDLAAILEKESLDFDKVMRLSTDVGLHPTVNAAVALNSLTAQGALPEDFKRTGPQSIGDASLPHLDLLTACIQILPGDNELEKSTRQGMRSLRLPFTWQGNPRRSLHTLAIKIRNRLSPNFFELREIPGGDGRKLRRHGVLLARRALRTSRRVITPTEKGK